VGERFRIATPDTFDRRSRRPSRSCQIPRSIERVVKAVSPLAGRSEAESLDDAEASARLASVMAEGPRRDQGVGRELATVNCSSEIDPRDSAACGLCVPRSVPLGGDAWNVLIIMSMVEGEAQDSHNRDAHRLGPVTVAVNRQSHAQPSILASDGRMPHPLVCNSATEPR
jgi:hypothetical protein